MACEVAVMNPQVEMNPVIDSYYHHQTASWGQPLSPDMSSPVYAHSPVGSVGSPVSVHSPFGMGAHSPLSHAPLPSPPMAANSPPAAHSPMMPQAAVHSPVHVLASGYIKQEQYDEPALCYEPVNTGCSHLTHLLKSTVPELLHHSLVSSMAPMGAPLAREILDGKLSYCVVSLGVCAYTSILCCFSTA